MNTQGEPIAPGVVEHDGYITVAPLAPTDRNPNELRDLMADGAPQLSGEASQHVTPFKVNIVPWANPHDAA